MVRRYFVLLLAIGCSKSEPTTTAGSSAPVAPAAAGSAAPPPSPPVDAATARIEELPPDAAPVAVAGPAPDPRAGQRRQAEEAARYAATLTATDDGMSADMPKRHPGSDLDRQIQDVRAKNDVQVGIGGRSRVNDSRGGSATPAVKGPSGRVTISDKQAFDDTTLGVDRVAAKILSVYLAGLKRCYKQGLAKEPSMRGKIRLAFRVNEKGRVVDPKATGFFTELDQCFVGQASSWIFPIPKDTDDEATDASFTITFVMVPD